MDKKVKKKVVLPITALTIFLVVPLGIPRTEKPIPKPHASAHKCPLRITEKTITPLNKTNHLLVSAYMDQRVDGFDIRIIGIFKRDSIQPLCCVFCCEGRSSSTTPTTILEHSDNFGFPYITTDVMCAIPQNCTATHVSLLAEQDRGRFFDPTWLPIRNLKPEGKEKKKLQFNFTVCISTLFGNYNNVLQVAQSLEMYR